MQLVDHFINSVADELNHLNGSEFEALCRAFIELITGREFELKGHNLEMKPVKGSVDLIEDDDFRVIGQCGTDTDYFSGTKPLNDIESSLNNSPNFKTIYLFCNRRAKGDEYQDVKSKINQKLKDKLKTGYHCHIYDGQRIAKKIYNNIFKAKEVEEILSYLPKSYEYYLLLPQSNIIPLLGEDYKTRPEEDDIIKQLDDIDFVQIYGLSGIGKSLLTLAVAGKLDNQFETVFWFDGNEFDARNLSNVTIKRMGESINLSTALELYKTLVIVDNLNEGVGDLLSSFGSHNKKGSKCIVTSLQQNIDNEHIYNLKYVSKEVSSAILMDGDLKPSPNQLGILLKQISGYPLLLELAKNAVDNEEMTWDDVINESNITYINDNQKNEEFAQRIVGRYVSRFGEIFNILMFLDTTNVSKLFLSECNRLRFNALLTYSIIHETSVYQCQIHQVVLSAVKAVVGDKFDKKSCLTKICQYLDKHTRNRDAGLYTFMAYHKDKVVDLVNELSSSDLLRHYALLAIIYTEDTYLDYDHYLSLIDALVLVEDKYDVDLILKIERMEIEQHKIKQQFGVGSETYKQKINSDIDELNKLNPVLEKNKALVLHHIGKLKSFVGDIDGAETDLMKAIQLDPKSYHSMLRLARNYDKKNDKGNVGKYIELILGSEPFVEVPISIRLSAYDLISLFKYKSLKDRYIKGRMEDFSSTLYAALAENYSQIYVILAKLADDLSYNYPDFYTHLCARLPLPLSAERNERIKKNYGKILAAQFIYGNYKGDYKDKLLNSAEYYLTGVVNVDDYIRKDLCKMYLVAGLPKKALPIAEDIENKEEKFMQQLISKVFLANEEPNKALEYIEKAIAQENPDEKEYCAAFRHDKAKCLLKLGDHRAKALMEEAIGMQTNPKTKMEWSEELAVWMK